MSSLKQKTADGLLWGAFSNGTVQVLQALFGLALLRLLDPSDHGRIAALVIFSNIASVLQESGFTAALANKKEPTHEEYNAVFWFNVLVGLSLYIILFFAAPLIADFYHDPVLTPLARFAFIGFFISSLGTAQRAHLFGHLCVKQTSITQLTAITVSGIVGVCLAAMKFAYWGLAAQSVAYVTVMTLMAWHFSPWRPTLHIDLRPAWQMFGFSSKLLINSLAFQLNNNAFGVLLTRFFGAHVAGIYSNARKWDDMAIATIGGMIQGVAQPVLRESSQHNSQFTIHNSQLPPGSNQAKPNYELCIMNYELIKAFRKLLRFTCFVAFPALFGLALIAEDFIVCLTGEKWRESAQLLQLLCIYGAFTPLVTLYSNLVISRGRSTVNMTVGLLNCALVWGGIILLHELGYALRPMVIYYIVLNISWLLVWQWWARHLIGLRWRDALKDILPFLLFAAAVMLATGWLTAAIDNGWWRMLLRIPLAAIFYIGILWVARAQILRESIDYLMNKGGIKKEKASSSSHRP